MIMIISAYGPQVGCAEEEKEAFLDDLEDMVGEVKESEVLVIGGYGERNEEGEKILDMAQRKELLVCNTRYRKKEEHLITFSNSGRTSQLDYILIKLSKVKNLKDFKVIPGSEIVSQRRMVVLGM